MVKSKSSQRWLKEHAKDQYVQQARLSGYRSRAVFKLQEIQQKYQLIRPGMTVVDLGAAPGGWSQIASEWVQSTGKVLALDILPMDALPDVVMIQGDFREQATLDQLEAELEGRCVDVLLSDMAQNMTGVSVIDQPRFFYLAELALSFAESNLSEGGCFLIKLFQGEDFDAFLKALRSRFKKVILCKPKASRDRSREVYALAKEFVSHS